MMMINLLKGDLTQSSKLGNIVSNNNIEGNNKVNINNPSGSNQATYKLHQTTVIPNMSFHATVTLPADFFQKDAIPKNFKILTINGVNTLVYFVNSSEYIIVPLNQLTTANVDKSNPTIVSFIKITTKVSVSSHTSSNGGSDGNKNETKPTPTPEPTPTQTPSPNPSPQPIQTIATPAPTQKEMQPTEGGPTAIDQTEPGLPNVDDSNANDNQDEGTTTPTNEGITEDDGNIVDDGHDSSSGDSSDDKSNNSNDESSDSSSGDSDGGGGDSGGGGGDSGGGDSD